MNKLIKIMFILCLCMANYASASNKDDRNNPNGSEDFNKMKHAWLKRFESENKTEEKNEVVQNFNQDLVKHQELFKNLKNELITEAKRMKEERIKKTVEQNILENENNKFLQLFNMGTISSGVISCLDLQSVECLQKICKKTRSKTIDILEKFPQLAQKLLNIDLAIHKDALFLYAQNTLYGENAVKNGAKDDIFRLLWDLDVGREDPLDFLDSLKKYQNLLCNLTGEHKPKWINGAINEIHEQIIKPFFMVPMKKEIEQNKLNVLIAGLEKRNLYFSFPIFLPLFADFLLKEKVSIKHDFFSSAMIVCQSDNMLKLLVNNNLDVNQKIKGWEGNSESLLVYLEKFYWYTKNPFNHALHILEKIRFLIQNGADENDLEERTLQELLKKNEKK